MNSLTWILNANNSINQWVITNASGDARSQGLSSDARRVTMSFLGFVSHYFISCCFTFFRSSTQCLRNPQHSSSVAAINGNVYFLLQVPAQEPWRLSSCHQFYAVAHPSSLEITSLPCITPPTSKSLPLSYCTPKLQYGTRALQGISLFSPGELYIRKGG